ncbi:hypothetical protein GCM10027290_42800 [Micromonospora sonneratiae]|uniref:DUF5709 domain-containing protein n=1 Tax=Micromonospora sonneratiae TaxID=1184706 RepID=A0ABW3YD00_9ACTN
MTQRDPYLDRPLEETPEVAAAVEDETAVPQFLTGGGDGPDAPAFEQPGDVPGEFPPTNELIGNPPGRGGDETGRADRTGAEQPWDPEDLAMAQGQDPTPGNVERARRELEQDGPAAIEKTVP